MRRFIFTAFALTVLAACQPTTTELTEEQKAEIAAELTQLADEVSAALRDVDVERYLTHIRSGEEFTFVQDGVVTRSWESYAEYRRRLFGAWASVERFEHELLIQILAPNAGVVTWTFELEVTLTSGNVADGRGTFTAVCSKVNGEWEIFTGVEYIRPISSS